MPKEQEGPTGFQMHETSAESSAPKIDFTTLVISLSTSAMMHMRVTGEDAADVNPGEPANLELARQTIDILDMLQAKTQGNLEAAESELLVNVLHDLRIHYVNASKS